MDTDDKLTDEGMAGGEPLGEAVPLKISRRKKAVLILIGVALFAGLIAPFVIGALFPARTMPLHISCEDNLRSIDASILTYDLAYGVFPESFNELVPNFVNKEDAKCPNGGHYYLDTTQMLPKAVCSVHGSRDNFDHSIKAPEKRNNAVILGTMYYLFLLALIIAYWVYLLWKKPFRRAGVEDEGA